MMKVSRSERKKRPTTTPWTTRFAHRHTPIACEYRKKKPKKYFQKLNHSRKICTWRILRWPHSNELNLEAIAMASMYTKGKKYIAHQFTQAMPEQKWTELLNSFEKTYDCAWSGLFKWLMLKTLVDWTNACRIFAQCTFWGHQHVNAMQWASSTEKTISLVATNHGSRTILWCHYTWIIRMIYDYWDFTVVLSTDKQTSNHLKKRLHLRRTFVISWEMKKSGSIESILFIQI